MDFRRLQRFIQRQRRQNRGEPFRQHGFSRAGRADEQDIVAAGRRDLQRTLHGFLAFHLGEIAIVFVLVFKKFCEVHLHRRDFYFAFQKLRGLAEILHRDDLQAFDDRRFRRIFRRHEQTGFAIGLCTQCNRQNAFAGTHSPCWEFITEPRVSCLSHSPCILAGHDAIQPVRKRWANIFPIDGLFDSKTETFRFKTETLKAGTYVLVLRVRDASGNLGSGDVVFTVKERSATK